MGRGVEEYPIWPTSFPPGTGNSWEGWGDTMFLPMPGWGWAWGKGSWGIGNGSRWGTMGKGTMVKLCHWVNTIRMVRSLPGLWEFMGYPPSTIHVPG